MKKLPVIMICILFSTFLLNAQQTPPPRDPITNWRQVQNFNHLLWITDSISISRTDSFELVANINASASMYLDSGFKPIGYGANNQFSGKFYGRNHTIDSLYIQRSSSDSVGFFSSSIGTITDIGLTNCNIQGRNCVGALLGLNRGHVINCYSTGSISGDVLTGGENIGGLVGYNLLANITNCYSRATVEGMNCVGGLIGLNYNYSIDVVTLVNKCYSTGEVTGISNVGGLIGLHSGPSLLIPGTYAELCECYSTSDVTGNFRVGGLVGYSLKNTIIENSFSRGAVSFSSQGERMGGLVGQLEDNAKVSKCYSTGFVEGVLDTGGLIGISDSLQKTTNSYWDKITSGQLYSSGGTGKSSEQMHDDATYSNWNFTCIWQIFTTKNDNYPFLLFTIPHDSIEPIDTDSNGFRNITKLSHIRWISEHNSSWSWNFELDSNINAADTRFWNCNQGFSPIGDSSIKYTGSFNGHDHYIDSLFINRPTQDYVGLFGIISQTNHVPSTLINSIVLTNSNIIGNNNVGGICGLIFNNTVFLPHIDKCHFEGLISGNDYIGGIVGRDSVYNVWPRTIVVSNCSSRGIISGINDVGGLIGYNACTLQDSYNRSEIQGNSNTGGAVGFNSSTGIIFKIFSAGEVNGTGGLVGGSSGTIVYSYWDSTACSIKTSFGGSPLDSAPMRISTNFVAWNFNTIWECITTENDGYPSFRGVTNFKKNIENEKFNILNKNIIIDIYPNPVNAVTNLTINSDYNIHGSIHVYTTLGQLIKTCYTGEIVKGSNEFIFNLQDLNEGSYYLVIENNSILSCKLIIISR
ncbi:MAG: GLUG motif-containing protein [bacterium]